MYQKSYYRRGNTTPKMKEHHPDPCEKDKECENTVHVTTTINITQNADARGGAGGNGGNSTATGGSASSAASSADNGSTSSAEAESASTSNVDPGDNATDLPTDLTPEEVQALSAESSAAATGGNATSGIGGAGGAGGAGGEATNTVDIRIDNVVIISCNGNGPGTALAIGMDERKIDITVDEEGNTFVNGKKMDVEELENGTKVLLFKSTEVKKAEE